MIRNYLKIAFRNMAKYKAFSTINIAGLSVGMAVTLLIGLWIWNECTVNTNFDNYNRIAQVKQHQTFNGTTYTYPAIPIPLRDELKNNYGSHFKHVVLTSWNHPRVFKYGEKTVSFEGMFMDAEGPEMLSLKMRSGDRNALRDPASVIIDAAFAKALFGDIDPVNKIIRVDNKHDVKVAGVYENIATNSSFPETHFLGSWKLFETTNPDILSDKDQWGNNSYQLFVQLADKADMDKVSALIRTAKLKKIDKGMQAFNPLLMLHPMSQWHLYGEFKNGVNTGGWITYVRLFGVIGIFVLLLACINFMNLSTARSEKRAREVGIRKAIGSYKQQLVIQFFTESLLLAFLAFFCALLIVQVSLPAFNQIANKQVVILWNNPVFWTICILLTILTGIIAGSYPAFYLSSFRPIKVLKGTFRAGKYAAVPRKTLVVAQFTISVMLIIGTIIVFRHIQFAQQRPTNYDRNGLVSVRIHTDDLHEHFDAVRHDLLQSQTALQVAESGSPITEIYSNTSGIEWKGKTPGMSDDFALVTVTHDYGKTMGWNIKAGRDFSREFSTDTTAIVINEAAAKYMNLKNPVGEIVRWFNQDFRIIGVVKDMVMQSPYEPSKQTIFHMRFKNASFLNVRLNPAVNSHAAIDKLEAICKKYAPTMPFEYRFVDQEYAKKFDSEKRVGKLAALSSLLAIFISCLGLFGMASFMAEQRIKEIGVRKVLGASVFSLWQLLSKEFIMLIIIALVISLPTSWYLMNNWLQNYTYHASISWWVFLATASGAILLTILTISYQSITAALHNPVKSLRSE